MPAKYRTLLWVLLACAGVYAVAAYLLPGRMRQAAENSSPAPAAPATPAAAAPAPAAPATAATAVPAAPAAGGRPLTITYWNMEWFPGYKPNPTPDKQQAHIAKVVPAVEKLDPDLLGSEEIAGWEAAQTVASHLKGFHVDVCSAFIQEWGPDAGKVVGKQQIAISSRLPLLQAWWENWKQGANGVLPRRGFAFAAYQPAPGQVLLVYGLHLKSNRIDPKEGGSLAENIAQREESSRQLLAHQKAMTAAYAALGTVTVVMGGDLNTSLDDPQYGEEQTLRAWQAEGFQWCWQNIPFANRLTLPSEGKYPSTCFDHLFFRGTECRLLEAGVEPTGKDCSDHRPVTVKLALTKS